MSLSGLHQQFETLSMNCEYLQGIITFQQFNCLLIADKIVNNSQFNIGIDQIEGAGFAGHHNRPLAPAEGQGTKTKRITHRKKAIPGQQDEGIGPLHGSHHIEDTFEKIGNAAMQLLENVMRSAALAMANTAAAANANASTVDGSQGTYFIYKLERPPVGAHRPRSTVGCLK